MFGESRPRAPLDNIWVHIMGGVVTFASITDIVALI